MWTRATVGCVAGLTAALLVFGLPAGGAATNSKPKPCPGKTKRVHGVCTKPAKPPAPVAPAQERFAVRVTASQVSTLQYDSADFPACFYRLDASFSVPSTTTITATLGPGGLTFTPQAAEGNRAIPFEVTAAVTYSGCTQPPPPNPPAYVPCGPATALIFPGLFELAAEQGKLELDYASIHRVFPGPNNGGACQSGIMETDGMSTPFDPRTLLNNNVTTVSGTWSRVQHNENTSVDFQVRFTRLP